MARYVPKNSFPKPSKDGISKIHGMGGLLAEVLRRTVAMRNISYGQYERLLKEFVTSGRSRTKDNRILRMFTIGNLRRELERPEMTWKVLLKGFRVLRAKHVKATFQLTFPDGSVIAPEVHLDLGTIYNSELDDIATFIDTDGLIDDGGEHLSETTAHTQLQEFSHAESVPKEKDTPAAHGLRDGGRNKFLRAPVHSDETEH